MEQIIRRPRPQSHEKESAGRPKNEPVHRIPFLGSLRTRLMILILLVLLPVFVLIIHSTAHQVNTSMLQVEENMLRVARLAAANQEQTFESARQLLITLALAPQVRTGSVEECSALLSSLIPQYPGYLLLAVADLDGNITCSSTSGAKAVNVADRNYFIQVVETSSFSVGDYHNGRITGQPSLGMAYPVYSQTGKIKAVVLATLDLSTYNNLAQRSDLQPGGAMQLIVTDRNGTVLMHYPGGQGLRGRSLKSEAVYQRIDPLIAEESFEASCLGEAEACLYAYHNLDTSASAGHILVTTTVKSAYAPILASRSYQLTGLLLVAVLAVAGAWVGGDYFLIRKIRVLSRAADQIASGNLQARTGLRYGPGELSQLAQTFDGMAASLEQRDSLLLRSEAARFSSEMRLANILQNASEAIVSVDGDRRIIIFNKGAEHIFSIPSEKVIGQPLEYLLPEPLTDAHRQFLHYLGNLASISPDTRPARLELTWKRRANNIFPAEVSASFIQENGQNIFTIFLADISWRRAAEQKAERQLKRLAALRVIDMAITGLLDLQPILNTLIEQVAAQMQADASMVLLYTPMQMLEYAAGNGFRSRSMQQFQVRLGQGPVGQAALQRQQVVFPESSPDQEALAAELPALASDEFVTCVAAPLVSKSQLMGVMVVFYRTAAEVDQECSDFLAALSDQAAIAIDSATLYEQSRRSNLELAMAYEETIEGWAKALELRDQETEGHSRRVVDRTLTLARAMGVPEQDLVHIRRGAILHDIGKMAVPDSILQKPGPLAAHEWKIMKQHPGNAFQLLAPIPYLRPALDIPYCHHERWDGSGYPRGLKGREIPLAARIFTVVDVWDALRTKRPYRGPLPEEEVRRYLVEHCGSEFDPKVVKTFLAQLAAEDEDS